MLRIQQHPLRKHAGGGLQVVSRFVRTTLCYERSTGGLLIHGKHIMITDRYISEHQC